MANQCQATNTAGEPCQAQPVRPDGYCYWHSPALAAERADNNRRGGKAKSNRERARKASAGMSAGEIDGLLAITLKGVLTGNLSPGQGQAAAAVARAMITVREHTAVEDLERRLADLERGTA